MDISYLLILLVFITIPITIGSFVLQFFLAKRESWWPGLILPVLFFLLSFAFPFFLMYILPVVGTILLFLLCNLPTDILLVIYFVRRRALPVKRQIKQMDLQDLE